MHFRFLQKSISDFFVLMLLEIDNSELLHMLECREALDAKTQEAVSVLKAHNARMEEAQFENGV